MRASILGRGGCVALVALLAVCVLGAGCGEDDREAAFHDATERVAEYEAAVEEARGEVEERAEKVAKAQKALHRAEEDLAEAQSELAEARASVGVHATDDVLFREIQSRLLDDDALEAVAVSARVEKGVVTLTGKVEKAAQRERAEAIARGTPGVISVENQIKVVQRGV